MSRATAAYPADRLTLREVGLRDGLQIAKSLPSTEAKIAWLEAEHAAGVRHYEVGSFLPATRFPQFADIDAMIATSERLNMHSAGLTLSERGAEAAVQTAIREMVCVVSATEEHSQANMRRSREAAVELVGKVVAMRDAEAPDKLVNAGIAMALGCSIAGNVDPEEVIRLAAACLDAGADIVGIADTVGYAGPKAVGNLCARMESSAAPGPLSFTCMTPAAWASPMPRPPWTTVRGSSTRRSAGWEAALLRPGRPAMSFSRISSFWPSPWALPPTSNWKD